MPSLAVAMLRLHDQLTLPIPLAPYFIYGLIELVISHHLTYWRVDCHEDACQKSAFTTYNGLYEFIIRISFRLCNVCPCDLSKGHAKSCNRIRVEQLLYYIYTTKNIFQMINLFSYMWPDLGKPSVRDPRACRAMRVFSSSSSSSQNLSKSRFCHIHVGQPFF